MIYSAVSDNWERVKIMHAVAREFLDDTRGSDFRRRIIGRGNIFPFDDAAHDSMVKESQIVQMLMAWTVITIESLANHTLAEKIRDTSLAVKAIEQSGQVVDKSKIVTPVTSDLSKKMVILDDVTESDSDVLEICDELANIRNVVVHDKPFHLHDLGEGEVKINNMRSRGKKGEKTIRYDDLVWFYRKCDKIVDYISKYVEDVLDENDGLRFSSLLNG